MRDRNEDMIEARGADISKDDDMLPKDAEGQQQVPRGGERPDSAGEHGRMAPGSAKGLDRARKE